MFTIVVRRFMTMIATSVEVLVNNSIFIIKIYSEWTKIMTTKEQYKNYSIFFYYMY